MPLMPVMFKGKLFKKNKIDCNFILSSELLVIDHYNIVNSFYGDMLRELQEHRKRSNSPCLGRATQREYHFSSRLWSIYLNRIEAVLNWVHCKKYKGK